MKYSYQKNLNILLKTREPVVDSCLNLLATQTSTKVVGEGIDDDPIRNYQTNRGKY